MLKRKLIFCMVILFFSIGVSDVKAVQADTIKIVINEQELVVDQNPVIVGNRTLIPLRQIFENLGATLEWDEATKTVRAHRDGTTMALQIGNNEAKVNGATVKMDVPGQIINNRTMVPLRFISEVFGANVDWDPGKRVVIITHHFMEEYQPTMEDLKSLLGRVYNKTFAELDANTKNWVKNVQTSSTKEVLDLLVDIHIENDPNWMSVWVEYFAKEYLKDQLDKMVELLFDENTTPFRGYRVNLFISAIDTDESVEAFSYILHNHPSYEIRYNVMYYFGRSTSKKAFDLLADYYPNETHESVITNGIFGLISLGGKDRDKMNKALQLGVNSDLIKSRFEMILNTLKHHDTGERLEIYNEWVKFLQEKKETGNLAEKKLAESYLEYLRLL